MARFKQDAHDVYEQNATFIHEKSLTRTVAEPSKHTHKNAVSWTSDEKIALTSPTIEEIYKTTNHYKNFSYFFYGIKSLITPRNVGTYGYSKNKSFHYRNISGVTTNTGLVFVLPGFNLRYYGKKQYRVALLKKSKTKALEDIKAGTARKWGVLYIKDTKQHYNF